MSAWRQIAGQVKVSPMRGIFDDLPLREIQPRVLASNPRCPDCRSPDQAHPTTPAMFHPEHRQGPCIVTLPGGDQCPCDLSAERQVG